MYRVGQKWNILFYSKTIENILKKLRKIINGIGEDVLVFYFHVFGETKGRPVKEVMKIFIEAYVELYLIFKAYISKIQLYKPD